MRDYNIGHEQIAKSAYTMLICVVLELYLNKSIIHSTSKMRSKMYGGHNVVHALLGSALDQLFLSTPYLVLLPYLSLMYYIYCLEALSPIW